MSSSSTTRQQQQQHHQHKHKSTSTVLATSVPTGTAGPVGASFAISQSDWRCSQCGSDNSGRHKRCGRCKEGTRPEQAQKWSQALTQHTIGEDHGWREALDPATKQIYYVHEATAKSSWERPVEMGPAPLGTGWFGRGGMGQQSKYDALNQEYLTRPAVKQAEAPQGVAPTPEGAGEFNIWFGKYQGEHWNKGNKRGERAETRCVLSKHAGTTTAKEEQVFFCYWFAKGMCHRGRLCRFHHRIPTVLDCGLLEKDTVHDVFGRERRTDHKDDMVGVSSIHDPSRTLYVGGLVRGPYENDRDALRECVERHFGEWGEIENINVVWRISVAFVRYRFRSNAEFAMEAMGNQSLDHEECVNVKWAREDPNPIAKEANARANADAVYAAVKAATMDNESSTTQVVVPAVKRGRIENSQGDG